MSSSNDSAPIAHGYVAINGKTLTFARAKDAINNLASERQIGFRAKLRVEKLVGSYTRVVIDILFVADKFWCNSWTVANGVASKTIAQLVTYGPSITRVNCGIIDDGDIIPYVVIPHLRVSEAAALDSAGPPSLFSARIQTDKWHWHIKQDAIDDILKTDSVIDSQYLRRGEATPLIKSFLDSVNTIRAAHILDINFIWSRPTTLHDRTYSSIAKMLSVARQHENASYLDKGLRPFRTMGKMKALDNSPQIKLNIAKILAKHPVRNNYCDVKDFMVTQLYGAFMSSYPELELTEKLQKVQLSCHVVPSKVSRQLFLAVDLSKETTMPREILEKAEMSLLPKVIPSEGQSCEVKFRDLVYTVGSNSVRWHAQRIEAPFPDFNRKFAWFAMTVPLAETKDGRRPVEASFEMPAVADDISDEARANIYRAHFNDADRAEDVTFCLSNAESPFEALKNGLNELSPPADDSTNAFHASHSAKEVYVSQWGISTLKYVLGFDPADADNTSNSPTLGEKFPWMTWVLNTKDRHRVHTGLLKMYDDLDKDQKPLYAALLGQAVQRLRFVNGAPGSGKTHLMRFVMLMAQYGDKTKVRPAKFLYVGPQNHHVNDMAGKLGKATTALGLPPSVVRLTNVFLEKMRVRSDLSNTEFVKTYLERANASNAPGTGVSNIQSGMSSLSVSADNTVTKAQPGRVEELSVQQGMLRYLDANNTGSCADLHGHLESRERSRQRYDMENWNQTLDHLIEELFSAYLGQLTGCVCSTPFQGSVVEFSKNYRPDVIFVDEGSRVSEGELMMVFRNFDPVLAAVFGDVNQLPVYVSSHGEGVSNPFSHMLERSTLHRAVALGLNDFNLWTNHRSVRELTELTSDLTYKGKMVSARTALGDIHKAQLWGIFLHGCFPRRGGVTGKKFLERPNRVIVNMLNSEEERINSTQINDNHADFVVDIAVKAATDRVLSVGPGDILIIPFYLAQVNKITRKLDDMVKRGSLTAAARSCIRVRTVDGSQGDEASLVIWDTVRSKNPGFTTDRYRLNVAMTRAKFAEVGLVDDHIVDEKKWSDVQFLGGVVTKAKAGGFHATVY